MRVLITGATGLLGGRLCEELLAAGHQIVALTRREPSPEDPGRGRALRWVRGDPTEPGEWLDEVSDAGAVVHLAGESIAAGRWTEARKRALIESRVKSTQLIADAIRESDTPPGVFLCASAVGYYGPRGEESLDEDSEPGSDFLARLCVDWEQAAFTARRAGVRVVALRFGVILSRRGGALAKLAPPFRLGVGGPIGPRGRFFPWVHEDDAIGILRLALGLDSGDAGAVGLDGPLNVVSPNPIRMGEFAAAMGRALRRPAFLPLPLGVLRIALGEMAGMLSPGQNVEPKRALEVGYVFVFADLDAALAQLFGDARSA
jgi:uncharacterized protein (TIGR01777 family)